MMRLISKMRRGIGTWWRLFGAAWAALCLAALAPPLVLAQNQANLSMVASFQGVMIVTDLTVSSGPALGEVTLQWTAPAYTGAALPLTYQIRVSTTANIDTVGNFIAAQPLSNFSPSLAPAPAAQGTRQTLIVTGLAPCVAHYFAIRGADSGGPQAFGGWVRSVPQNLNLGNFASSGCADIWPPAPVTDLIATAGTEGQMLLQWTAPDSNNNALATRTPASGYAIRIATFSVGSVGGSTTSWWNSAMDVRSLPLPALSVAPPAPGQPGTQESLLLTRLEPGATMYALIKSTDSSGLISDADVKAVTPGGQAFALIYDAVPPTPTGLAVAQTGISTFTVTWSSVTAYDLDYYRIYLDSTAPRDFADAWSSTASAAATSLIIGGLPYGTYAVRITAVDKGAPANLGLPLESPPSAAVTADLLPRLAQTPYGIGLSTAAGNVTLRWLPVVRHEDGTPFIDPNAPTVGELSAYRVYRSSTIILGSWTELASVSTATLSWTGVDTATAPYYAVRAESNGSNQSLSGRSLIRSAATLEGFILAPDDQSYYRIPAAHVAPLVGTAGDPASAYAIVASSRPQELGGRVYKSMDFQAYRGGLTADSGFSLEGMGTLYMHYAISGSSLTPSFSGAAAGPQNASVYWWNGMRWVQLYGKVDTLAQNLFLETKYFGRYQIRSVERVATFAFNLAGLSNHFVTPNGDGKNDNVVFTFDNPHDAVIRGRILDLRGRVVVADLPPGPAQNSLQWDGTAGGRGVPGGVYIYKLDGEGQSFTGTIVILK